MNPTNFFVELKRRNVYRAAVAYGVVAWFLTQLTTQVFPFFEFPNSAVRFVVIALAIGFPIAMLLSWVYEFTPEGIVRTEDLEPAKARSVQRFTGRILDFIIIGVLLLAIAMLVVGRRPFYRQAGELISQKSIAVLPFENLSRDPDNAYFATGIQDEILTRIAKIGALKVISRISTRQYSARPDNLSEIGHQLGVANILEGSVQRAGDQVHVNVQLIRAATDEHIWAESYDRKLENIFGVEGEVAAEVAEALKANLTGAEQQALRQKPTNNPEAYSAYLRGIALWGDPTKVDDIPQARKAIQEAVRRDPNFSIAWAVLAQIDSDAYFYLEATPERRAAAQSSLDTAMRLNPELPEAQVAQAMYQFKILRDFEGAKRSFQQLETKLPNNTDILEALGQIALQLGQWKESQVYVDRAIGLNPRNLNLRIEAAWAHETMRDFPGALRCFDEALEIWPDETVLIAAKTGIYQSLGELDQADELLKKLPRTHRHPITISAIYDQAKLRRRYADGIGPLRAFLGETDQTDPLNKSLHAWHLIALADLQRLSGNSAAAEATYSQARDRFEHELKEEPDHANSISEALARVYAGLGNVELANRYIERAINLTRESTDAWFGPTYEETRARIAARFGQKDLAISILEHLLKIPYRDPLTPALLRLDPDFDSLRGDPRFQKLCEEKQP